MSLHLHEEVLKKAGPVQELKLARGFLIELQKVVLVLLVRVSCGRHLEAGKQEGTCY